MNKTGNTTHVVKRLAWAAVVSVLLAAVIPFQFAQAALSSTSLNLGDSRPGQTGAYTVTSSGFNTGQTIGCIEVDLGSAADGTGAVSGLDTSSSTLGSQSVTATGTWTVDNTASAAHTLRLTNATPVAPQSGSQTAAWNGIVNGDTADTGYYAVITTYQTDSCSTAVDSATVQFIYTDGQAVSLAVDSSLSFSVSGTSSGTACNGATSDVTTTSSTIPLGDVTPSDNQTGVQNLNVTTNAGNGYTVSTRYTAQPTSGSNTIDDTTGSNTAPASFPGVGTEAFGYTTNDSSLGTGTANRFTDVGNEWAAFTTSNAEVAYSNAAVSSDTTCVGQQAGVSGTTEAGTYTTTVIYTATPLY